MDITFEKDVAKYISEQCVPNHKELGKKLKNAYNKEFIEAVNHLTAAQIEQLKKEGCIEVLGIKLDSKTDIEIKNGLCKDQVAEH